MPWIWLPPAWHSNWGCRLETSNTDLHKKSYVWRYSDKKPKFAWAQSFSYKHEVLLRKKKHDVRFERPLCVSFFSQQICLYFPHILHKNSSIHELSTSNLILHWKFPWGTEAEKMLWISKARLFVDENNNNNNQVWWSWSRQFMHNNKNNYHIYEYVCFQ